MGQCIGVRRGPGSRLHCWLHTLTALAAIDIGGMVAPRENRGWCGSQRAGAAAALGLRRGGGAGWESGRGLSVTSADLGVRTRLAAWRWGLDLRVAQCCLDCATWRTAVSPA